MRFLGRRRCLVKIIVIGGILILLAAVFHSKQPVKQVEPELVRVVSSSWRNSSYSHLLINDTVSNKLLASSRILCFVMTTQKYENTKARAVSDTWGKRCTKLLFITSYKSAILVDSFVVNVPEGRAHLTAKTMQALRHLYEHYIDDYDYFIKVDDDTYIIVENLQLLLTKFNPNEPIYLGFHFRFNVAQGYMSGGGAYLISRKGLRMVVIDGIKVNGTCAEDGNDEDVDVALCLEKVGVFPYVTYDKFGRHSFHVTDIEAAAIGPLPNYLRSYPMHPVNVGPNCCSQFSITFHYTKPEMMYVIDVLLYRISVFGWDVDYDSDHIDDFFTKKRSLPEDDIKADILYFQYKYIHAFRPFIPVSQ